MSATHQRACHCRSLACRKRSARTLESRSPERTSRSRRAAVVSGEFVSDILPFLVQKNVGGNMTSSFRAKSFLVLAVLLLCALPAAAQTATARVEGIVTYTTGAVLPVATVTATNPDTNASRVDVANTTRPYT